MADATVIVFPRSGQVNERERLRRAMERLQAALGAQRRALSDWRFAMTELGVGVAGLGHSLASYQESLSGAEARLAALRIEGARLATGATLPQPGVTDAGTRAGQSSPGQ